MICVCIILCFAQKPSQNIIDSQLMNPFENCRHATVRETTVGHIFSAFFASCINGFLHHYKRLSEQQYIRINFCHHYCQRGYSLHRFWQRWAWGRERQALSAAPQGLFLLMRSASSWEGWSAAATPKAPATDTRTNTVQYMQWERMSGAGGVKSCGREGQGQSRYSHLRQIIDSPS